MRVSCWFIKENIEKRFSLSVHIFVSKKKKHVYFAFKKTISLYSCLNELVPFLRKEWGKRDMFFRHYEIFYPKLVRSVKWRFGYVFSRKKNVEASRIQP